MELCNQLNIESNANTFYYAGKIIEHKQIIEVQSSPYRMEPIIDNYFSSFEQPRFIKVTQVRIQDQLIKIIDIINIKDDIQSISCKSNQVNDSTVECQSSSNSSVDKKSNKINLEDYRLPFADKKTKKNAIKNLIKIFMNWLKQNGYKGQLLQTIQKMIGRHKYNTRLVYELFKLHAIRGCFILFGQGDAEEYIKASKIVDKAIHIKILQQYLSISINLQGNLLIKNGEVSIIQSQLQEISHNQNPLHIV